MLLGTAPPSLRSCGEGSCARCKDVLTQPLLLGKKAKALPPEGQGGRQRGHPTAGLGHGRMGEDVLRDEAAALALWTDRRRGSLQGTKCKTQHEPPAEPRRRAAQPGAATQPLPSLVSPPGWGEGAHTAPQLRSAVTEAWRWQEHGQRVSLGNGPQDREGELC